MNRSLVRPAACALAAASITLLLLAVPASSPSQAATITINGLNCSWDNVSTLTCSSSTGGGTFGCSVGASPSAPALTQAVTLTANCSNAAGSIAYTWTASGANAAGCPSIASGAQQEALAAPNGTTALNCTYSLSANDTATTATTNKSLSYSTGGGGGGGGGGGPVDTSACTALGLTAKVVVASWNGAQIDTVNGVGFGPNDALIVQFTTGSFTTSTTGGLGALSGVEFSGPTTPRAGALSTSPCDFTVGMAEYSWKSKISAPGQCNKTAFSGFTGPSVGFSVAALGDMTSSSTSCQALLQPNTTYYWNLTNFTPAPPNGTQQCNQSACNMRITLTKPVGG
jgi:hypothetical protein